MTTVADEGNRRKGDMGNEEILQCVQDIKSWFLRSKSISIETANTVDIQKLEKSIDVELPAALKVMLLETNGSLWFMDKEGMTTKAIQDVVQKLEGSSKWRNGIIPFCGDEAMGMLVIDTLDGAAVLEWDEDDGVGEDPVSSSLASYLEGYRNQLLSGKCEFLGNAGVIEKVSKLRK